MKVVYLLGHPLGHSVSPAMQNAAFQDCGLADWRYETLSLPPERLDDLLAALRAPDCVGANVTVPYKEIVIPRLDGLTDTAREIGAVNTILKREGRLIGENTDAPGFLRALQARSFSPQGSRVVLFGAGGAARAVAWTLARENIQNLTILNRTLTRANSVAGDVRSRFPRLPVQVNRQEALPRADFVINATSVGMWPGVKASPLPADGVLRSGALAFDLVYQPRQTRFLLQASQSGARPVGGLDMLIYQGALAFSLWTHLTAPLAVMAQAARAALDCFQLEES